MLKLTLTKNEQYFVSICSSLLMLTNVVN